MGLIKNWADVNGTKHQVDPTGHTHSTSESWLSTIVTNLTTLINGKAATVHTHTKSQITDFAHTHAQSDVTGLADALTGKAASTHTHTKSQITDFAHTHTQSDVTGLTTALSGKVDKNRVSANHPIYTGGLTIHYEMGESVTLNNEGSSQTDCSTPIKLNLGDKIRILNTRGCKTSIYALNGDMFSFINGHTITRLVKEEGVGNYAEYTSASEDYYVILACYQNGHSITEHTYEITRAN